MRQSGVIAAAGIYALEHHLHRLVEDHDNARLFAERIATIDGITVEAAETNMVFFDVEDTGLTAAEVNDRLLGHGVRIGENDRYRMRAVTHLDVSRAQIEEAAEVLADMVGGGA